MRRAALALLLAGCAAGDPYEEAAREAADAIGRPDLVVLGSASNFARTSGRTVRLRAPEHDHAAVRLSMLEPGRCEAGPCADSLRAALARAGETEAAARAVMAAFAPCGAAGLGETGIVNPGTPDAFVRSTVWLGPGGAPDACAEGLEVAMPAEIDARRLAPSGLREAEAPLLDGWEAAARAFFQGAEGYPAHAAYRYRIAEGTVSAEAPMLVLGLEAAAEEDRRIEAAAADWLADARPNLAVRAAYADGPFQVLLPDGRIRVLVILVGPDGSPSGTGVVATHEIGGATTAFELIEGVRGPGGLFAEGLRDRL